MHAWEAATGAPLPYVIGPRRSGDIPVCYANADKARAVLGWEARRSVEDMCRDAWRWQRQNPCGYRTEENLQERKTH